jgi:glyoxylase-like metal-dependent hydrolase (beta-lactamase superfamily II)
MSTNTVRVGDVLLTRVGYADIGVDPAVVGLTPADVTGAPWAQPTWADGEQVRVGAAAWVIESGDVRIVVDPAQAADDILRGGDAEMHQTAFAELLEQAGLPRESFTHAIASHLDGIGMFAWRTDSGSWTRFFPNAPLLMSQRELDSLDGGVPAQGKEVLTELRAQGAVQAVTPDVEPVADGVTIEFTGGHSAGHQVVRIDSRGEHAVMLGHLALSAMQLAFDECPNHVDPVTAVARLKAVLAEDAVLIAPLWPAPGAGRWNGRELVPVF